MNRLSKYTVSLIPVVLSHFSPAKVIQTMKDVERCFINSYLILQTNHVMD